MFSVLLIDDEPTIVRGLRQVIPWSEYGCEVAAEAYDGLEGLAALRAHKPDILFTDIRMPYVDGLSMISGIKSELPNLQITVLTAFRDFDYAQQAVNLGVARYLLKPSKMPELLEALAFMTEQLKKRESHPEDEAELADLKDNASSFVVRNVLNYIEAHYNEKLTLTSVADKVYVSQWHLSKLLKKHADRSFSDILNTVRVARAKKLLEDPWRRVSEVSDLVGFSDVTHFAKIFKKYTGLSANEYRNSLKI